MRHVERYKRILLKISGETLMGEQSFGIDQDACDRIAKSIQKIHDSGLEVSIVIGGGNIFRGIHLKNRGMERTPADQIGMLSTLVNGISLQRSLHSLKCPSKLLSAIECPRIAETYSWTKAIDFISTRNVLIFVGGTGNPYFTTDSAAALRASEIEADVLLKATKVDGIYTKDPLQHTDAVKYSTLSYSQMLAEKLEVMDATAVQLCRNARIPIFVFNMRLLYEMPLLEVISSENGTLVSGD